MRTTTENSYQGLCGQGIPDATINETQRQKVHMEQRIRKIIPENKERVVRGTGVRDANGERDVRVGYGASVVAISGILHQEQEWNGKTVLRPIAYGSKVLSDTEMKYGAPKAEMFAVVTFVEKYRAYLGSEPFKLRVDNRALSWLKTYSMDQSYIGRWIVRLDGYNMIIEHRTREKHQNADSLSKKTEFYEGQEQREADRPEIKDGYSFMDEETYDSLATHEMARQVRQTDRRSSRVIRRAPEENDLEEETRDTDRDNAQVKNRERDAEGKRL